MAVSLKSRSTLTWVASALSLAVVIAMLSYFWVRGPWMRPGVIPERPARIAHAGGACEGVHYSNSLTAINQNYQRGVRYFEIDFTWTKDGTLVCLHDWGKTSKKLFGIMGAVTRDEYHKLKMIGGLQQITADDLLVWLRGKRDAYLITDVKDRNLHALEHLSKMAGDEFGRIIPQIYDPSEYAPVNELGYRDIILTLYRCKKTRREIIRFAESHSLWAITLPKSRAGRWRFSENLAQGGVFVYAHTVNEADELGALEALGVSGVYTDVLFSRGKQAN